MARVVLALALTLTLTVSVVSGCVRPIFDGRAVSGTGPLTADGATTAADASDADPTADAHTRALGI